MIAAMCALRMQPSARAAPDEGIEGGCWGRHALRLGRQEAMDVGVVAGERIAMASPGAGDGDVATLGRRGRLASRALSARQERPVGEEVTSSRVAATERTRSAMAVLKAPWCPLVALPRGGTAILRYAVTARWRRSRGGPRRPRW